MNDFQEHKRELMKDPEFLREYEAMRPEYEAMRALIGARLESHLTQEQLAQASGVRQSNISRIESGACSPTVATLQKLAAAMGKKLQIRFE